jgi:hypothetical protein
MSLIQKNKDHEKKQADREAQLAAREKKDKKQKAALDE